MATRHTDYDRRRHSPRRDRDRDRGDRGDRYGEGRFRDDRDRRDRRDDRREPDRRERDRDTYRRRSRSPPPRRRDRSRDRGDRGVDRGDSYRRDRDGDRDRDRRRRSTSRRPGSRSSVTPAPGSDSYRRDDRRDDRRDRLEPSSRDERKKDPETQVKDKLADRAAKLAEWKKLNAERLGKEKTDTPGSGASPAITAPATPSAAATPPPAPVAEAKLDTAKTKAVLQKSATEKLKQKQPEKSTFRLDASAAARPLDMAKPAGKTVTASSKSFSGSSATNHRLTLAEPPVAKANGNIGAFGLKTKTAAETEEETSRKALLDEEGPTKKRKLQALPEFTTNDEPEPEADGADHDSEMSGIGSDDEENNAEFQARLEKRRAEIANENQADATMGEASAVEAPADDKMEVDENAGAEEDEIDPLDAFMADLSEPQPSRGAPSGQAMFADELEPVETSVEAEDLLALRAAKKKKKEVPTVNHDKVEYEPFRKNFYTEPSEVAQMTPEEVADLRHELDGIKVKPDDVPRPVTKWAQMGLLQATMDVFTKIGYERPTGIQSQGVPTILSGRDLIGVAKTGSGKTLAFGIPMIRHVLDQRPLKPTDGPIGLILAPTRELALQIVNELKPFLAASGVTIKCAYGGQPISDQIAMIKRGGIHILCATPGRMIDLTNVNQGRVLSFRRITYVVLDEADRMFDMGFEPQVMKILANVRPDRQTVLFSATMPKNMQSLARKALHDPAEITIGGKSKVAPEITQVISVVPNSYEKKVHKTLLYLGQLFSEDENAQVLIFTERQETAEDLLSKLYKSKYFSVNTIHGAKDQTDRNEAINDFKQGVLSILIATSVAARGLDVPGLAMVLNFDSPTHLEDYVHRCGRTGRAGNKGTAITLIENPGQERFALHIVKALKESGTEVPPELQEMANTFHEKAKAGTEKYYGGFGGKGLDKLDAARALEKKREKRQLKLEGVDESDEEEEIAPIIKKPEVAGPGVVKAADPAAADAEDQPHWMKLLNSKIVVSKTERPEASASGKPMTARERAMAAASKVDGRLSKKGMIHAGQPIDNKGPDAGLYHSTIEINDFPQKARWAVTNRTNVAKILEQTGVSITTKGNFYPAGKQPGETDLPKLYILVEGDTENIVTQAMMELTRLLREGTIAAEDASATRGPTGRYSVV